MDKKDIDCSIYENCLRNQQVNINLENQENLHMLAVGCWGVYCDDGECIITKYKKNKLENIKIIRGQKQVANALIKYCKKHEVTDMYLAGDNVYQVGISTTDISSVENFLEEKQNLIKKLTGKELDPLQNFNMELQISKGFEMCFNKAKIDRFFVAIGNHDIENCNVLNKQYNYNVWNMPSLYYNVIYDMKNFNINIIVLDTNMFEDEPITCSQKKFTEEQILSQIKWALSVSKKGDWNIVIGHIPYIANGHKKDKHPIIRNPLKKLIESMEPNLYICADEHNQQFIYGEKTSIVIAGSGGTALDNIIDNPIKDTLYQKSTFGFVSYEIYKNKLKITFISAENEELFSYTLRR